MATSPISQALAWLTTRKGASFAGAAILGLAVLIAIGRSTGLPPVEPARAQQALPVADTFTPAQAQAIREIVKDYLMQNPEVMLEVGKELERRQQAQQAAEHQRLIVENKGQIFASPLDYVWGNPKGDVTLVEFFDYNCGWCKRAVDDLVKLSKADAKVRIVMKEFPIFGDNSIYAAKAAMASVKQGKYWEFHLAMMREKQVTKDNVMTIAQKVGLDVAKLKADMEDPRLEATLKETHKLATALNIEGTPGFILDTRVNVGYLPVDGLQQLLGEIRKAGCRVC